MNEWITLIRDFGEWLLLFHLIWTFIFLSIAFLVTDENTDLNIFRIMCFVTPVSLLIIKIIYILW